MAARLKSEDTEIPTEIVREILLKLPTKDVARSCFVCKLWRDLIRDDSFRKLHAGNHAAAPSQVLLVSENREPGRYDEARVFSVSPAKALCCITTPPGYSLTNICNGFLCFARSHCGAAPIICNPVTGEKRALPTAPHIAAADDIPLSHIYALGFSPSTQEYKLFRFAYPPYSYDDLDKSYMDVYTMGSGGGWRHRSYLSPCHAMYSLPPVHIDGKLYMMMSGWRGIQRYSVPDRMLVVDVATETYRSYHIPEDIHQGYDEPLLNGFELNGRMCLAVNVLCPRHKLQFWVMGSPDTLQDKEEDYQLNWELRYSFYVGPRYTINRQRGVWLDDSENLCYRHGITL